MSDSEEDTAEKQFKIVVVGDPATGKVSVKARLFESKFDFHLSRPSQKERDTIH